MSQNTNNSGVETLTVPNFESTSAVATSIQTYCRNVVEVIKRLANQIALMNGGQSVSAEDLLFDIDQANADVLVLLSQLPPIDDESQSGSAS